jgi:hypothetical protein
MKCCAVGVRMHSGWGALVAISGTAGALQVIDRRRINITPAGGSRANQPYHFAENLDFPEAERFLQNYFFASAKLASAAVRELIEELRVQHYRVAGGAVLLASGRRLPPLAGILVSHALIHAAEGEFFREIFWKACKDLEIPVTGFRERNLDECVAAAFGNEAPALQLQISTLGRLLGPPWTTDQKTATLAASIVLVNKKAAVRDFSGSPNFQYLHPPLLK